MIAHKCQQGKVAGEPATGLWFLTIEENDGRLWLHTHGGTEADMDEEISHLSPAPASVVRDRTPLRAYPQGGSVPGYVKPTPRKAVV